ncbi:MAG: SUMF1/EgtB/PvdO family nonheme iron enzyme [Bryobacteraceae bacterium]
MGHEFYTEANAFAWKNQAALMTWALRFSALAISLVMLPAASGQTSVDFQKDIQPVLESSCISCHGSKQALGGLRLDTREALLKGGSKGPAVVPGQPDKSSFYTTLEMPSNRAGAMPPGGPQLSVEQRQAIRQWIAAGASWPAGITIGAAGTTKPATTLEDDAALAAKLHERISSKSKQPSAAEMKPYKESIPGTSASFEMVPIPGGEFTMGTPESEPGRNDDEGPQHKVKIDPFWMGKHEVSWDTYRLFMFSQQAGEIPGKDVLVDAVSRPTRPYVEMSFGMGINGFPAISMTQHAANKYAQWVSARTGHFYRLPTEAEWEYACRAGTTTAYSFGDDASKLEEYAWYADNTDGKYAKVGTKKPNPWGLYDMHGNVMEWTLDQYVPDAYQQSADKTADNPWIKATEPYPHAVRGGSWMDGAESLRCGARVGSDPSWKMQDPQLPKSIWYHTDAQGLGLRLVRPLKTPSAEEMYKYWNSGVEQE